MMDRLAFAVLALFSAVMAGDAADSFQVGLAVLAGLMAVAFAADGAKCQRRASWSAMRHEVERALG